MPHSRRKRVAIGVALIFFGFLGFLPVLGFWMIPLGVLVLSYEFAFVRRFRRRGVGLVGASSASVTARAEIGMRRRAVEIVARQLVAPDTLC